MATALNTNVTLSIDAKRTNTLTDGIIVSDPLAKAFVDSLTDGTGLDQCDLSYHATRTLTASTAETLDLYGGLTDAFGVTLNFVKVKLILIVNKSTTAGYSLTVGAAAAPFTGWTTVSGSTVSVGPGGCFFIYNPSLAGMAVTNTTADGLKVNNANAASVSYDIVVLGTSA